jgi:hypothetical protein
MYNEISSQSRFTKHGPCQSCGSKDNVAWYASGSGYCFGCGKFYPAPASERLSRPPAELTNNTDDNSSLSGAIRPYPDDCNTEFPSKVMAWIGKYDLDATDLIKANIVWSPSREQLIYRFYGEDKDLVLWQARNFREGTDHKHRFFTGGRPEKTLAAYYPEQASDTCCLVEDCISGLKLAKAGIVGIPCFSAAVSAEKLTQIAYRYENVLVWLDSDKFKEACKISNRAKLLDCRSRVVATAYDPKEYDLDHIKRATELNRNG